MQLKTSDKEYDLDRDSITEHGGEGKVAASFHYLRSYRYYKYHSIFPLVILFALVCALLLLDAVLPLRGLGLAEGLPVLPGQWTLGPTNLLFPGWATIPHVPNHLVLDSNNLPISPVPPSTMLAWQELPLLLLAIGIIFLLYLVALRYLPRQLNRRYILVSTLVLGSVCVLIPVVTSSDIFSYIIYARMGAIYHFNPLTTLPNAFPTDPTYFHLYWTNQPSAYGPTWAVITSALQYLLFIVGFSSKQIVPMIITLRLLGLTMHVGSTWLIWSIGGRLQRLKSPISPEKRLRATLAFAWNPLLLFEACVNAHNDTTLLFLLLLAIWFLLPRTQAEYSRAPALTSLLPAIIILATATCLKINTALLLPGLLLFIWTRGQGRSRIRALVLTIALYLELIVLFYAPFWQNGAILNVLRVNPTASRNINTLPDFLTHLYNSIIADLGFHLPPSIGSPAETITHTLSTVIFIIVYLLICWQTLMNPHRISTWSGLIRWLTLVWFLYCAIGSAWLWPWYLVTFFGFYALFEMVSQRPLPQQRTMRTMLRPFSLFRLNLPLAVRLLALSMFSLYCFYTWGPYSSYIPGLPGFKWAYLQGVCIWLLPLLANHFPLRRSIARMYQLLHAKLSD